MKKLLVTLACVAFSVSSYAQGFVNFNTGYSTVKATVTDLTTGQLASGTAYFAQLYAADGANAAESSLTAKGSPVNFKTGTTSGYVQTSGTTSLGTAVSSSVQVSATAGIVTVEVRAWGALLGGNAVTSYEDAVAANGGVFGHSNAINVQSAGALSSPPYLVGLQSFTVNGVPEPTTIALGVMGAAALLFRRRK